ncbi:chromosome segregation and condensation protein ScpB [Rhodoblastus acidophilus]|uniref:SMC-Scp complex subunit ScpB n=1 Tax=Rhodoblastus acidophilus TaxID=1074 RepID=UPI002224A519|nr:SMC-Scp complex subunit ScpB [Rhodoblastus acidophilus]MCW2319303.1 chromosome segregation and condensation protein ScpB [Rhodoblastus acidophilus]
MGRRASKPEPEFDRELDDLPPDLRWREWMGRVEAVIFAAPAPVGRDVLQKFVGRACNLDLIIDDIRAELHGRPYDLVAVAGGWQHRTKSHFGAAIRAALRVEAKRALSQPELSALLAIGYFQPVTRRELSNIFGQEVSRDLIANLRAAGFIGPGPRSPQPGAPATYVTTDGFLSAFGFASLRDLPDLEALEDAGLLDKAALRDGPLPSPLLDDDDDERAEDGDLD